MAYFPESLMPQRLKDESQDVKGNQYIVSAADFNKHDEEIRAIQFALGVRTAAFPASGYSGCGGCPPADGSPDPSGASMFDCFSCSGANCYPAKPDCAGVVTDVATALTNIFTQLERIRDTMCDTASGIVAISDDSVSSPDGKIPFPTSWYVATLAQDIPDASTSDDDDSTTAPSLADIPSLTITSTTPLNLQVNGGYITIINDMSQFKLAQKGRNLNVMGLTSLGGENTSTPYYNFDNQFIFGDILDATELRLPSDRVFGLGTNVEIMAFDSIVLVGGSTYKLLNVQRKQRGTTSTAHKASDLVFMGRLSIEVSPVLYKIVKAAGQTGRLDDVSCCLRSNGQVNLIVRSRDPGKVDYFDQTQYAYAEWQATLVGDLDPIPMFNPAQGGECV